MFGSWFDHVKGWLNAEDKARIMYISYEEMIMVRFNNTSQNCILQTFSTSLEDIWDELCVSVLQDLKDSVARMAQFLEKSLDPQVIEKIADRCVFKNMKQNKMSNYSQVPREIMDQTKSEFLRKGMF